MHPLIGAGPDITARRDSIRSASSPIRFGAAVLHYLGSLAWSRVSATYRVNPFFELPQGVPRVEPKILSPQERATLLGAV